MILISCAQVVPSGMHARLLGAAAGPIKVVSASGSPESTCTTNMWNLDIGEEFLKMELTSQPITDFLVQSYTGRSVYDGDWYYSRILFLHCIRRTRNTNT